ncbi:MAG: GEVED domain-containing protein [Chitinophagaceae bacterium]
MTLKKAYLFLLFFCISSFTLFSQTIENFNIFELMEREDLTLTQIENIAEQHFEKNGKGQGSGYKHFQRWLYEQKFHVDDAGYKIAKEKENDNYVSALQNMQKTKYRLNWNELGPKSLNVTSSWNPGFGRCYTIAIHPSNESIIYVGTDGGGIWKTTNGGTTWFPLLDFENAAWQNFYHIALNPQNPNTIYAGLKNGGVIKSYDAGATWFATGVGTTGTRRIVISSADTNLIMATGGNGIYRSTNGGTNWNLVSFGSKEDLTFKPNDNNILYASSSSSQSFWRSTDAGQTWTVISNGITHSGRTLIGTSPNNPNIVYVVQANGSVFGRMYKSTDAGLSFTTTIIGDSLNGTNFFGYSTNGTGTTGQATHDMAIGVNPSNANEVHIAGIICWKSTDGGYNFDATTAWTYPNSIGYNHADVHYLLWVNNTLYSTSDGGAFKSINNANDWINISYGLGIRQFYRIACAKNDPAVLCGGTQDNGSTFRQSTGNWYEWLGADGMDCIISPVNSLVAIGSSQYGSIYKTVNAGNSRTGLSKPSDGNWVTPLAWHPTDADTVYGGWDGVYCSPDQGSNWIKLSGNTILNKLDCIAVAPSNANYIYASDGAQLYITTNAGNTWNSSIPGGNITSICVSPLNPEKVFITTTSSANNVKESINAGFTFNNINAGLPAIAARSIVVDDNPEESIYVAMNIGVYYKDNINPSWVVHANGLPLVAINELEIQKSGQKLRAATYGRGVWESELHPVVSTCQEPSNPKTILIGIHEATLTWDSLPNAQYYKVEYKASNEITWHTDTTYTASYWLQGLNDYTNYEWRVQSVCFNNQISLYVLADFKTLPLPCEAYPTNVSTKNISCDTAMMYYSPSLSAANQLIYYKPAQANTWIGNNSNQSPHVFTNLAIGKYNSSIQGNCLLNQTDTIFSDDFYINCKAIAQSSQEYISLVAIESIYRKSGNDLGYFFESKQSTNLIPGSQYTLTVSPGFTTTAYTEYWAVYIDLNQNGIYDLPNEQIATSKTIGDGFFELPISIPNNVLLGKTHMRVIMSFKEITDPCQTGLFGEIEDYIIQLSTNSCWDMGKQFLTQTTLSLFRLKMPIWYFRFQLPIFYMYTIYMKEAKKRQIILSEV